MQFKNPSLGRISLQDIGHEIKHYICEEPESNYKLVIGTDSQSSRRSTLFVSVIIIHRIGKGSRFFYFEKETHQYVNLHDKIYTETQMSLELTEILKNNGVLKFFPEWPIEIHLDIGNQGETRSLIGEITGWVSSLGYTAKIKPDSYGASVVADRYTKIKKLSRLSRQLFYFVYINYINSFNKLPN